MAKIKRVTSSIKEGINSELSGTNQVLFFPRKGVIAGVKESIKVKRPNQYKKKSGLAAKPKSKKK